MRSIVSSAFAVILFLCLSGCVEQQVGSKNLFAVDFAPDITLRYKMVFDRAMGISLGESDKKKQSQKTTETLSLVMAYKPIEIDPYGLSTIEVFCESAKVSRLSFTGQKLSSDAVKSLAGRKFTIQITPTGKIAEHSELTSLVKELGEKAFVSGDAKRKGRRKNADMIFDFVAMQLYFWESISSIEKPLKGVDPGQSWTSIQHVPLPVPMRAMRETIYTLDKIDESPTGQNAIISSTYSLSKAKAGNWPIIPYSGKFGLKGSILALLRNYKYKWLKGTGSEVFNIDRGVLQSRIEEYEMEIDADLLLPLGDSKPKLTIKQTMSIKLLED